MSTGTVRSPQIMAPHILHIFPTFATGGVQLRIVDVANRLGNAFRHTVLTLDGRTDACARLWPQTPVTVDIDPNLPKRLTRLRAFRRCLRAYAPNLVCTYNWGSMNWTFATASLRLPHLHFESGFGVEEADAPLVRRSLFRRLALRHVRALVVPSETLHDLARRRHWVPEARVCRIANGVDVAYYRLCDTALERETEPLRVVAVAPLRREKRLDRLIEAASSLTVPMELLLCGEGPERPTLEGIAHHAGLDHCTTFLGFQPDVRSTLESAALFAMTSRTEQMPNALLQAMAMELPVIAFDAGDIRQILPEPQRAFVFAQTDMAGFRAGLETLLGDSALRRRLGAVNRQHVTEHYAMEDMVSAYRALYDDALAAGR